MRVIFLDIDGVVNTLQIYKEPPAHIPKEQLKLVEGYYVDICSPSQKRVSNLQAVTILDKICHEFNLKIVISSTWRLGHYSETIEALRKAGLSEDIEILGATPNSPTHFRGEEIKTYLDMHKEIDDYIIFDDDDYDLCLLKDRLFKIDTFVGITFKTYKAPQYCHIQTIGATCEPGRLGIKLGSQITRVLWVAGQHRLIAALHPRLPHFHGLLVLVPGYVQPLQQQAYHIRAALCLALLDFGEVGHGANATAQPLLAPVPAQALAPDDCPRKQAITGGLHRTPPGCRR